MMNPAIALYVTACLHGMLHGVPHDSCREQVLRAFPNDAQGDGVLDCTRAAPDAIADMIAGMHNVGIEVFLPSMGGWRCAPRKDGDEP